MARGRKSFAQTYAGMLTKKDGTTLGVVLIGNADKKVFTLKPAEGGNPFGSGAIGQLRSKFKLGTLVPVNQAEPTAETPKEVLTISNPA